jgi:hypothetical protein
VLQQDLVAARVEVWGFGADRRQCRVWQYCSAAELVGSCCNL